MSKSRRKPGRLYWLWTFAVGIWDPGKGQRRVASTMAAKDARIAELETRNTTLTLRSEYVLGEKIAADERVRQLEAQLAVDNGVRAVEKVKTDASRSEDTLTTRVSTLFGTTDPGVIRTTPDDHAPKMSDQSAKAS